MTDAYAQWTSLDVRRPEDVPAATPLSWKAEREAEHAGRMANLQLPDDFPHEVERGTASDALAVLALRESIRQDIETGRGLRVRDAMEQGATWAEVAGALDVEVEDARALLRTWASVQHTLHRQDVEAGRARPFGLTAEQHAAVRGLCALGDHERAGGRTTQV
ncbi:hypothetical protein ACGFXC_37055 [Streptomyces sp. NPDC048507]|uniref:hypothetical protein n=1 Tax=Streptomyces sp. NPDC048507 TaxID=3365560 RepID=UPI00371C902A